MTAQRRTPGWWARADFDFAQLDAVAADFYLVILAAEELDDAGGEPADAVAGAVEFFAVETTNFSAVRAGWFQ